MKPLRERSAKIVGESESGHRFRALELYAGDRAMTLNFFLNSPKIIQITSLLLINFNARLFVLYSFAW
jgi:hypothetical protein